MTILRFQHSEGFDAQALAKQLPAGSLVGVSVPQPGKLFDLDVTDEGIEDAIEYMTGLGYTLIGTDPTAALAEDAARVGVPRPKTMRLDVSAGGTFEIKADESGARFLVLEGVLFGNVKVVFPATDGQWWNVRNSAVLGIFGVDALALGSSALAVKLVAGGVSVWSDGVDLFRIEGL